MRKDLIKDGYMVIDSSYTQAANPNSMRNFGPTRNVIYNFTPVKQGKDSSSSEESTKTRAKTTEKKSKKALIYSKTKVRESESDTQSNYSLGLTVVKANDYTKNISQSIFAPGEVLGKKTSFDTKSQVSVKSKLNEKPPKRVPEQKINEDIRPRLPKGYMTGAEVRDMIKKHNVKGRDKAE